MAPPIQWSFVIPFTPVALSAIRVRNTSFTRAISIACLTHIGLKIRKLQTRQTNTLASTSGTALDIRRAGIADSIQKKESEIGTRGASLIIKMAIRTVVRTLEAADV